MPNIKSAKKRMKQSKVRQLRNRSIKGELRTIAKKVGDAIAAGKMDDATETFKVAAVRLDQAASKKTIHKNAAARKKSRLSRALKAAKQK